MRASRIALLNDHPIDLVKVIDTPGTFRKQLFRTTYRAYSLSMMPRMLIVHRLQSLGKDVDVRFIL